MENKIMDSVGGGFWTKPVIIFVLLLLLLIPLGFISSMISDRAYVKRTAEESIKRPSITKTAYLRYRRLPSRS